jgi:hypothetical protein
MGVYLNKPITEKESVDGYVTVCGQRLPYAAVSMQGWRTTMEDSYCVQVDFDESVPLLGVFDGHGGK